MEKIWLKNYPEGIPAEIDIAHLPSLVTLIDQACQKYADQVAYVSAGVPITFAQVDAMSRQFAAFLQAQGFKKGDRIALMMPNMFQYPIAMFGVLRAGCSVVNVNPLYTPRELEFVLKDSGARAIVIIENFAHTLQQVVEKTPVEKVIVTSLGELLGPLKGPLINFVLRKVKKMVPAYQIPARYKPESFRSALAQGKGRALTPVSLGHEDMAFLQYTGGTTGVPKAAVLTHENIASNVMQAYTWIAPLVNHGKETIVTALPLYHIFALTANCLVFLMIGARNVLIANPRDIPMVVKMWSKQQVTAFTGVNTLFNALLNDENFRKLDFSAMRVALGGGMAVQAPVAARWKEVTNSPLLQAYGLTETSPAATINPMTATDFNGSIGLPIPSTEVSIRDEEGRELGIGEVGEICIRGPQVMSGYWQRPEETAKVMWPDRYLRTGDMGYVNNDGFVFIVDRMKDMILVSGFNVYPNEVEEAAVMHNGILECAAVGIADERSGEIVKLFVVRKDPTLTEKQVIEHCRTVLTAYKVPKIVEFRDELPKTNVGKILRRALRDEGKAA